jgi:galactose mutarotase-like enzyme
MISSIENEFLKISAKDSGAELISIKNKKNNLEYLWQGDPQFWGRRAPVLFPIVGKLNANKYKAEGNSYELPQHGFARDAYFDISEKQDAFLTFILKSNPETLKVYPYKFELHISYKLIKNRIEVIYEVRNTDDKKIWFSIGAHPAFNCPIDPKLKFGDYFLEFEIEENADKYLLEDGLLNGKKEKLLNKEKKIQLTDKTFLNDAIIFKNLKSSVISLKSNASPASLNFNFKGFPFLGIWSKPGPFVCIEPWFGHADMVNFSGELKDKEGIQGLGKGASFSCSYSVEII